MGMKYDHSELTFLAVIGGTMHNAGNICVNFITCFAAFNCLSESFNLGKEDTITN